MFWDSADAHVGEKTCILYCYAEFRQTLFDLPANSAEKFQGAVNHHIFFLFGRERGASPNLPMRPVEDLLWKSAIPEFPYQIVAIDKFRNHTKTY